MSCLEYRNFTNLVSGQPLSVAWAQLFFYFRKAETKRILSLRFLANHCADAILLASFTECSGCCNVVHWSWFNRSGWIHDFLHATFYSEQSFRLHLLVVRSFLPVIISEFALGSDVRWEDFRKKAKWEQYEGTVNWRALLGSSHQVGVSDSPGS